MRQEDKPREEGADYQRGAWSFGTCLERPSPSFPSAPRPGAGCCDCARCRGAVTWRCWVA